MPPFDVKHACFRLRRELAAEEMAIEPSPSKLSLNLYIMIFSTFI